MKRKLLPGLFIVLSMAVGAGFSSCKDNDEDIYTDLRYEQQTISNDLNQKIAALETKLAQAQAACKTECATARQELETALKQLITANTTLIEKNTLLINGKLDTAVFNTFKKDYEAHLANYEKLVQRVAALETKQNTLDSLQTVMNTKLTGLDNQINGENGIVSRLATAESAIITLESTLNTRIDSVITVLNTTTQKAIDAYNLASTNQQTIANVSNRVDSLVNAHKDLVTTVGNLNTKVDNAITDFQNTIKQQQAKLDSLEAQSARNLATAKAYTDSVAAAVRVETDTKLTNLETKLQSAIDSLGIQYNTLSQKVDDNYNAIQTQLQELENSLKQYVNEAINKIVTSVLVQATENPIFGSIAFPMNISSNVLVAYYGVSKQATFDFPAEAPVNIGYQWTAADLEMIKKSSKFSPYTVVNGDYMVNGTESDPNAALAGKLYLTINPNTVNFAGTTVKLVNSRDEASGVQLQPLAKSDKLITFGVGTRAADNGFYEAEAIVPKDQLESSKLTINIDKTELKSTIKGVFQSHTSQDLANLVKLVYNAVTGTKIPAYGVKAEYSVDGTTTNATYSNYNIAAVTFQPLSFQFAEGVTLKNLPTIPTFDIDKVVSNLKANIKITIPDITIKGIKVDVKLDTLAYNELSKLTVTLTLPTFNADGTPVVDSEGKLVYTPQTFTVEDLGDELAQYFNHKIDGWNEDIATGIQKAMEEVEAQIQAAINDALNSVSGQLNESIANLLKQIEDEVRNNFGSYTGKLSNYISNINHFINRANNFLTDPNHYLQVLMLYQGTDGQYYQGGHTLNEAAVLRLSGGNAIRLFPTTYNAEIVVPTFKKFVAVTNVYGPNGATAQGGDATCLSLLNDANAQTYMNEVIPGERLAVPFKATKAGYTYEIIYSALDYRGVTSTRKFYLNVVQ